MSNSDLNNVISLFSAGSAGDSGADSGDGSYPEHRNSIYREGLTEIIIDTYEPFMEYPGADESVDRAIDAGQEGGDLMMEGACPKDFYDNFMRRAKVPLDMNVESLRKDRGSYLHSISLYQGHEGVELDEDIQEIVDDCTDIAVVRWYELSSVPNEYMEREFVAKDFRIDGRERTLFALREDIDSAWRGIVHTLWDIESKDDAEGSKVDTSLPFTYFMEMRLGTVAKSPLPKYDIKREIDVSFSHGSHVYTTGCNKPEHGNVLKEDIFSSGRREPWPNVYELKGLTKIHGTD